MRTHRGIALFAALALMALIGLLVAGAVASSAMTQRSSRLSTADAVLTTSADYALSTLLADARGFGLADLPFGQARTFEIPGSNVGGARVSVSATRLPGGVVWLVADATMDGADQSHRRVNLVVRFPLVGAVPGAAIVARGDVRLGSAVVFQPDSSQDAECAGAASVDVVVAPGAVVSGGDGSRVSARPIAADSATYFLTASQLALLDSAGAVVHVHRDTTIAGGSFEGILIVDGSVTISGPLSVNGMIVARDRIVAVSGGLVLRGNIFAFGRPSNGDPAIELSAATLRYSPCLAATVLRRALAPRPVRQRSWAEMF